MKISKKSWHYKVHHFWTDTFWDDPNTTLCYYFWTVVGGLFKGLFIVGAASIIVFGLGFFLYLLGKVTWLHPLVMGEVFGVVLGAFLLFRLARYARDARPIARSDNLVVAYLRARKQRFCPLIEFTDPDEG